MSDFNTCDIRTIHKDVSHPHEREFNFDPKFKWEGVVTEVSESSIKGDVYDEFNNISSEIEISKEIIGKHQLYYIKVGTLFYLYSGENLRTKEEGLLFELKKEPFHITSFDDMLDMYSDLDISQNIKQR